MDRKALPSISVTFLLVFSAIYLSSGAFIFTAAGSGAPLGWTATHPTHMRGAATLSPTGLLPTQIRHAYGFDLLSCVGTNTCGAGQVGAIVDAYDDPNIASDLATFSSQFGLPACTPANGCFAKATPQGVPGTTADGRWRSH